MACFRKAITLTLVVAFFVLSFGSLVSAASKTLEYYALWNPGEDHQKVMAEIIADFEKANPGVTVKVTWAGREVLTKVRSRLLMGNPPDLIDQDFNELSGALLADSELALPLNDLLNSKGPEGQAKFADIFFSNALHLYDQGGKTYFIPYEFITSGFYYDKNLFKKYSLSVPKTWDELMALSEKLKAKGIAPFAQDGTVNIYNAYWYYWLVNRELGPGALLQAARDKTGKAWDNPGFLSAANKQYSISKKDKKYFQDGYEGSQWPAAQIGWARGDGAMILCGTWIPNETGKARPSSFDVGFFPFPAISGGKGSITDVEAYLIGFAIPKKAKNPELAKEFIKFALQKKYQARVVEVTQNMAARKDSPYPSVLSDVKPVLESATKFHLMYDGTMAKEPEWFNTVFVPLNNQLLYGDITPEQFIKSIKQQTIDYWKKK